LRFAAFEAQAVKGSELVTVILMVAEASQEVAPSAAVNQPRVDPEAPGKPQPAHPQVRAFPQVEGQIQPAELAEQRPPAALPWVVSLTLLGSGQGPQLGQPMERQELERGQRS